MSDHVIHYLVHACVIMAGAFTALYGTRSVWYRSWTGRWAFSQSASLLLLLVVVDVALTFPDWSARPYVRVTSYGLLLLTQVGGVAVLIYQQTRKPPTQLK